MINIKNFLLLSLAVYVAYGGDRNPPTTGDSVYNVSCDVSARFTSNAPVLIKGIQISGVLVNTPQQEPIDENIREHGAGTSGSHTSSSNTRISDSSDVIEYICNSEQCYFGPLRRNTAYRVNGIPLILQGNILSIDGRKVQEVNTSLETLVIEWIAGVPTVNGKIKSEYNGKPGKGTWTF